MIGDVAAMGLFGLMANRRGETGGGRQAEIRIWDGGLRIGIARRRAETDCRIFEDLFRILKIGVYLRKSADKKLSEIRFPRSEILKILLIHFKNRY